MEYTATISKELAETLQTFYKENAVPFLRDLLAQEGIQVTKIFNQSRNLECNNLIEVTNGSAFRMNIRSRGVNPDGAGVIEFYLQKVR